MILLRTISVLLFSILLFSTIIAQKHVQFLNENWVFSEQNSSLKLPAFVPGNIFRDLQKNNIIQDPFWGTNELQLQWVSEKNWEYHLSFIPDNEILNKKNIFLCFESLDTRADIYLNNSLIFSSFNMFVPISIDVKELLYESQNHLKIVFFSPVKFADSLWKNYPVTLPDHPRVMIRKAGYHFGWDWGPALPGCGIRKKVYLEAFDDVKIENVHFVTKELQSDYAIIESIISLYSSDSGKAVLFNLETYGDVQTNVVSDLYYLQKGTNTIPIKFTVAHPRLWWPNGMGEQYLYRSNICVLNQSGNEHLDCTTKTWGIRTTELVQVQDNVGSSFGFRINGKDVFIKGANYIPAEFFHEESTIKTYESLIQMAHHDNMNMLRVWGGGVYENDEFYALCDQYGIMVWQDFMFACAMYPFDEAFLQSVRQEAVAAICRLRNHPSIVLWCGNNESDEGWHNWGWQKSFSMNAHDSAIIYSGYKRLFVQLLPHLVDSLDGTRPYWPSSPSTGWGREKAYLEGDVHYWGVWWGMRPFETFKTHTGRFISEYGFQALPQLRSLLAMGVQTSSGFNDATLRSHQKHPRGFETINAYMNMYAHVPTELEDYVYLSQYIQYLGIRTAIEAHRRAKPYCMGTLYWQLNDCWPVISWSGIDYYGRKKALQFHMKELFNPITLSIVENNAQFQIWGISDNQTIEKAILKVQFYDFYGKLLKHKVQKASFTNHSSALLLSFPINEYASFEHQYYIVGSLFKDKTQLATSVYFPLSLKQQILPQCHIQIEAQIMDEFVLLKLNAPCLHRFVEISYDGETNLFDQNYFDLLPKTNKTVKLMLENGTVFNQEKLTIRSLNNLK